MFSGLRLCQQRLTTSTTRVVRTFPICFLASWHGLRVWLQRSTIIAIDIVSSLFFDLVRFCCYFSLIVASSTNLIFTVTAYFLQS